MEVKNRAVESADSRVLSGLKLHNILDMQYKAMFDIVKRYHRSTNNIEKAKTQEAMDKFMGILGTTLSHVDGDIEPRVMKDTASDHIAYFKHTKPLEFVLAMFGDDGRSQWVFFSERAVPITAISSDAAFTWLRQNKVEVSHEELNAMTAIRLGVIIELERDLRKARGTGTQSKVVRKIEKDLERTGFAWGSEIKFPISSNKIT